MKPPPSPTAAPPPLELSGAYQKLRQQLAHTGWICHGTVVRRSLIRRVAGRSVKKGPYYMWTCKVAGKTVCRALSRAQYQLAAKAIANQRRLAKILEQMHRLTLATILEKVPGVSKRK